MWREGAVPPSCTNRCSYAPTPPAGAPCWPPRSTAPSPSTPPLREPALASAAEIASVSSRLPPCPLIGAGLRRRFLMSPPASYDVFGSSLSLMPCPDPDREADEQRHTDEEDHQALGDRADPAEPEPARIRLLPDRGDEGNDVPLLLRGELRVTEHRHRLRA